MTPSYRHPQLPGSVLGLEPLGAEYSGGTRVGSPLFVMVRRDRTISLSGPVRTGLGKPMVRSSRTMT